MGVSVPPRLPRSEPPACRLQDRCHEDVHAPGDRLVGCTLLRTVAATRKRGHEQHGGVCDAGDLLRIVGRSARHLKVLDLLRLGRTGQCTAQTFREFDRRRLRGQRHLYIALRLGAQKKHYR